MKLSEKRKQKTYVLTFLTAKTLWNIFPNFRSKQERFEKLSVGKKSISNILRIFVFYKWNGRNHLRKKRLFYRNVSLEFRSKNFVGWVYPDVCVCDQRAVLKVRNYWNVKTCKMLRVFTHLWTDLRHLFRYQFHQHFTGKFFVQTSFWQLFSSYM